MVTDRSDLETGKRSGRVVLSGYKHSTGRPGSTWGYGSGYMQMESSARAARQKVVATFLNHMSFVDETGRSQEVSTAHSSTWTKPQRGRAQRHFVDCKVDGPTIPETG
jgi:hypothetical protein